MMLGMLLLGLTTLLSCNKDDNNSTTVIDDYSIYSSATTLVSEFELMANTNIYAHLDSVHFTIDQDRGLIYNADSLPKGTNVSALCVDVTCPTSVASKEFIIKGGTVKGDTVIKYTSTTKDSIDFTGDVTLRITSYDGLHVRDYGVKVNVHQQEPDTLVWNTSRRRDLPGVSGTLVASKTARQGDDFLCLVQDNSSYILSKSQDPLAGTWDQTVLSLPFVPIIRSFAASDDAIYLLDSNGTLMKSDDNGATWTDCGVAWRTIIGGYGNKVLGLKQDGASFMHDEYPQGSGFEPSPVSPDFPVDGMSQLVMARNEWTTSQQAMIAGGILASGSFTGAVWGYDGNRWGQLNQSSTSQVLPALAYATLVPYYSFWVASGTYSITKHITWMVIGGRLSSGSLNTTTYISRDQGLHWNTGISGLQLPSYMPAFFGAQAFAYSRKQSANAPRRYSAGQTTAITSWDCPYLYLFGGYASNGNALNSVWEGVITRLTYKPVF